jgi:hypothetical protein
MGEGMSPFESLDDTPSLLGRWVKECPLAKEKGHTITT